MARMIAGAPLISFLLVLIGIGVAHLYYMGRIATLNERIKLKDDRLAEYKDKLHAGSPDEAKQKMEALAAQVAALAPRRLTSQQKINLQKAGQLHGGQPTVLAVLQDMGCYDCAAYAGDLSAALQYIPNWSLQSGSVMGPAQKAPSGLGVCVGNPASLSAAERALANILQSAHLDFDIIQLPMHDAAVGLLVSTRLT